jgi:hypothetical protein
VTGGSAAWRNVSAIPITASGATDGLSGIAGYQYRESPDDGATWGQAHDGTTDSVTAQGETLVQMRAVDGAGNTSAWAPAGPTPGSTALLDSSLPTAPNVSGGSTSWQSVASVTITAGGSSDIGSGFAGYQYRTSTDGGTTWSGASSGSSDTVTAAGHTLVQFRSVDVSGLTSAWTPAAGGASNTVRIDRTAPSAPSVSGGSTAWQKVASVTVSGINSTDAVSGIAGYQCRESRDGGATWAPAQSGASDTVTAEGETLVQVRSVDKAGNPSAWAPAAPAAGTVRIDRTAPTVPTVSGGSAGWQHAASVTVTGSGSTDSPGSGVASYQYRTSTDGGKTWSAAAASASVVVSTAGQTLFEFRSVDISGLRSSWSAVSNAGTVKLDRTAPTAPKVAGGSLSWTTAASGTVSASGSTDAGGSALAGYEYRTSADNGATWSQPQPGAADTITAEGQTVVQFRSVDGAGNHSVWVPATPTAASTVRLDRTAPVVTAVTGGSLTCAPTKRTIKATATDAGSGVKSYEYQVSTDNGLTWLPAAAGQSVTLSTPGTYLVQFRATDALGNVGVWAPAAAGAGNSACIS